MPICAKPKMSELRKSILPNFLIIGAARSGTTTLYKILAEHSQVYLPAEKRPEPHFFMRDLEYAKGLSYYSERYFSKVKQEEAIGEASTSYIFSATAAARIARDLPRIKLILMLRHPVERAFSNYWHTVKSGLETLSFEQAVARENERCFSIKDSSMRENQPFAYLGRSLYFKQLSHYLEYFAMKQFHIILFDDLTREPATVLGDVCRFLDVNPQLLSTGLDRIENASTPHDATLAPKMRTQLLDFFAHDVAQLESLLKRDLSNWKR